MKFAKLAEYYEKLEATSKRLELVDILSKLFKESSADEIGKICYLIQGRVAPFFEPTELGMAESLVAQAIALAYGATKDEVIKSYRQLGNIGLAAKDLASKRPSFTKVTEGKQRAPLSLKLQRASKESKLSVSEVFEELLKIAKFSGKGTVEQKVTVLSDLLKKLDSVSVKHVSNIPLGTLRLGIGDPTVMDALSIAKTGNKDLRPLIEDAYNKTSDLGYVAEEFYKHGAKGLSYVRLIVGKPVRPALAERMPNAEEAVKRLGDEFAAEPKFDGFRVQVHISSSLKSGPVTTFHPASARSKLESKLEQRDNVELRADGSPPSRATQLEGVKLFSRNLEDMTHAFPDLVEAVKKEVHAQSAILEGEAIAFNPTTNEFLPFQETTKRRRKYEVEEMAKKLPLALFAFDVLYLNGQDVTDKPHKERRKLLEGILHKDNAIVRLAEERIIHTPKEILAFFNEAISEGLEGLMLKKLDSPYKAGGRGFHWIKFKRSQSGELNDTVDVVLLGVFAGKGKRTDFGVGGLLVGVYNKEKDQFCSISRVGTGLTDVEFRKVNEIAKKLKVAHKPARVNSKIEPQVWLEPKVVLEILADEITKSPIHTAGADEDGIGYALRFPRLVKFREADKRPEDATTVDEIKKLYQNQYKKNSSKKK